MSVSLSQNSPLGGLVAVKNIPVDHLSNKKLQVSEVSGGNIMIFLQYYDYDDVLTRGGNIMIMMIFLQVVGIS